MRLLRQQALRSSSRGKAGQDCPRQWQRPFAIPNVRVENPEAEAHTRIGWFRSVSNIPHAFAVQSFAAELAAAAGRDPKEYLLELIGSDRLIDAAAMSDDGAGTGSRLQAATAA